MDTLFPATFTWAGILADITSLIANPVVIGGLGFVLAVRLAPRAIRVLKSMVR